MLASNPLSRQLLSAGGMDPRRVAPKFAPTSFHRSLRKDQKREAGRRTGEPVVLWVDSFTDGLNPDVARAAIAVLEDAGFSVIIPDGVACCGLTWITTGQLDGAKKRLLRLLDILGPYAAQNIPIVGLEPSCTAVLRSDLVDLLPDDPRSAVLARAAKTLAEVLTSRAVTENWSAPDLAGVELIVQPHCHHHSVMGYATDQKLLTSMGATLNVVSGCCGLAGNFGMEKGHYDMSVAIAGHALLPALRDRSANSIVLADGFSCRTQIEQLAGLPSLTLAQLLAAHLNIAAVPT
jgi:Fe-S oxidoreductase